MTDIIKSPLNSFSKWEPALDVVTFGSAGAAFCALSHISMASPVGIGVLAASGVNALTSSALSFFFGSNSTKSQFIKLCASIILIAGSAFALPYAAVALGAHSFCVMTADIALSIGILDALTKIATFTTHRVGSWLLGSFSMPASADDIRSLTSWQLKKVCEEYGKKPDQFHALPLRFQVNLNRRLADEGEKPLGLTHFSKLGEGWQEQEISYLRSLDLSHFTLDQRKEIHQLLYDNEALPPVGEEAIDLTIPKDIEALSSTKANWHYNEFVTNPTKWLSIPNTLQEAFIAKFTESKFPLYKLPISVELLDRLPLKSIRHFYQALKKNPALIRQLPFDTAHYVCDKFKALGTEIYDLAGRVNKQVNWKKVGIVSLIALIVLAPMVTPLLAPLFMRNAGSSSPSVPSPIPSPIPSPNPSIERSYPLAPLGNSEIEPFSPICMSNEEPSYPLAPLGNSSKKLPFLPPISIRNVTSSSNAENTTAFAGKFASAFFSTVGLVGLAKTFQKNTLPTLKSDPFSYHLNNLILESIDPTPSSDLILHNSPIPPTLRFEFPNAHTIIELTPQRRAHVDRLLPYLLQTNHGNDNFGRIVVDGTPIVIRNAQLSQQLQNQIERLALLPSNVDLSVPQTKLEVGIEIKGVQTIFELNRPEYIAEFRRLLPELLKLNQGNDTLGRIVFEGEQIIIRNPQLASQIEKQIANLALLNSNPNASPLQLPSSEPRAIGFKLNNVRTTVVLGPQLKKAFSQELSLLRGTQHGNGNLYLNPNPEVAKQLQAKIDQLSPSSIQPLPPTLSFVFPNAYTIVELTPELKAQVDGLLPHIRQANHGNGTFGQIVIDGAPIVIRNAELSLHLQNQIENLILFPQDAAFHSNTGLITTQTNQQRAVGIEINGVKTIVDRPELIEEFKNFLPELLKANQGNGTFGRIVFEGKQIIIRNPQLATQIEKHIANFALLAPNSNASPRAIVFELNNVRTTIVPGPQLKKAFDQELSLLSETQHGDVNLGKILFDGKQVIIRNPKVAEQVQAKIAQFTQPVSNWHPPLSSSNDEEQADQHLDDSTMDQEASSSPSQLVASLHISPNERGTDSRLSIPGKKMGALALLTLGLISFFTGPALYGMQRELAPSYQDLSGICFNSIPPSPVPVVSMAQCANRLANQTLPLLPLPSAPPYPIDFKKLYGVKLIEDLEVCMPEIPVNPSIMRNSTQSNSSSAPTREIDEELGMCIPEIPVNASIVRNSTQSNNLPASTREIDEELGMCIPEISANASSVSNSTRSNNRPARPRQIDEELGMCNPYANASSVPNSTRSNNNPSPQLYPIQRGRIPSPSPPAPPRASSERSYAIGAFDKAYDVGLWLFGLADYYIAQPLRSAYARYVLPTKD